MGAHPGVKPFQPEVDRICAVLDRRASAIPASRGREKFRAAPWLDSRCAFKFALWVFTHQEPTVAPESNSGKGGGRVATPLTRRSRFSPDCAAYPRHIPARERRDRRGVAMEPPP